MALKFNPTTGKLDVDGKVRIANGTDNVIVRFDGTNALQGYTSNAPTITDDGKAQFGMDAYSNVNRIGATTTVTGDNVTVYGELSEGLGNFASGFGYRARAQGVNASAFGANSYAVLDGSAFGYGANAGQGCVSFGNFASTFGRFASFAIGRSATCTDDNQWVAGGPSSYYFENAFFGAGVTNTTARNFYLHGTGASGTDASPGDFYFRAGAGTGAALGGSLIWQVTPSGASGAAANAYVTAMSLNANREFRLDNASFSAPIRTVTASAPMVSTDHTILCDASSGDITISLTNAADVSGRLLNIKKIDNSGNKVTIDASGTQTIDGALTSILTTQYESITIQCDGTGWWIL